MNLDIELFTPVSPGGYGPLESFINEELYNESAVKRASRLALDVESVRCIPLMSGCNSSGAKACADKVLDAQLGFKDQDSTKDTDDGGVSRYSYCDPSVFVFHPPRTYANENVDLQRRRKQLVATLANARSRVESNENLDSVPVLTIENVCPGGPFEYLLTEPSDVAKFKNAKADLQREQSGDVDVPPVRFTVDLGHAPDPVAMLDAVECPAHVHLHGPIPITEADRIQGIRDKYEIDDDVVLGPEEPPCEIQHLPPQDGQHDLDRIVDAIDPVFDPGEQPAYHTFNYGWLVGELIHRISGQHVYEYVAEHVFDPLGMDNSSIGLGPDEDDDVATLSGFEMFDRCRDPGEGLGIPASESAEAFNDEGVRRAVIPAANGICTARDMARFYACMANGGELDGTRLLDEETVAEATRTHAETDSDGTLSRPARYALGFWTGGLANDMFGSFSRERMFGHAGLGSIFGWADPELNVGFAYVTNGIREETWEHAARISGMSDAVRLALLE